MLKASAPGKIILSGEHAVVYGFPGIAVPYPLRTTVTWEPDSKGHVLHIQCEGCTDASDAYIRKIIDACEEFTSPIAGTLHIENDIPIGRGMGSSTALVVAICRCVFHDDAQDQALEVENQVNPGHSGIDFTTIWSEKPVLFRKGQTPKGIELPADILQNAMLIDTGKPNETTAELVAWVHTRSEDPEIKEALATIGTCTDRLQSGEDLSAILPDHHRAQVALGVVTPAAQALIAEIEQAGGAGKVLGAGAQAGGGGMVLALHRDKNVIQTIAAKFA